MKIQCDFSVTSNWSEWQQCFLEAQSRTKCYESDTCVDQMRKCFILNEIKLNKSNMLSYYSEKEAVSLDEKLSLVKVRVDGEWSEWIACNNGL